MNNVRCVYTHQALSNRSAIRRHLPVGLGKEDGVPEAPRSTVEVPKAKEKPLLVKAERRAHGRNASDRDYSLGLLHVGLGLRFPLLSGAERRANNSCPPRSSVLPGEDLSGHNEVSALCLPCGGAPGTSAEYSLLVVDAEL